MTIDKMKPAPETAAAPKPVTDSEDPYEQLVKLLQKPIDPVLWEKCRQEHEEEMRRKAPKTLQVFPVND